jgi:glycosyltransferase involved in cell wall biosynthesis
VQQVAREILLISEARIATVQLLEQVLSHLQDTTSLRMRSRTLGELRAEDFTPETYPLIVRAFDAEAARLVQILRRHHISYGFYLDDNFWLLDPETVLGRHYSTRHSRRRLESAVEGASTVITATPLLRDYLKTRNPSIIQLDSFFDFSLLPTLPPAPPERTKVRGGFAASTHRVDDLKPILTEMLEALDEHPDLEFELVGVEGEALPSHPRLRTFRYRTSYREYLTFLRSRQWDFGLAPLGGAASNLYKTDNKYREYAAQGIPGIYQDAAPYAQVRAGETGLFADGPGSWRAAIDRYLREPDLRSRIRLAARADAENRLGLQNVAPRWAEFFETAPELGSNPARLERVRHDLDRPRRALARAATRGHLLWAYGRTMLAEEGLTRTARRTARFVGNRIVRRRRGPLKPDE